MTTERHYVDDIDRDFIGACMGRLARDLYGERMNNDDDAAKGSAQERGYRVLILLAGHEFEGMAPGEIAKALDTSPANISRDLRVLQRLGLAECLETLGRWRLGPKVVQIAVAFQLHLNAQRTRLDEVTNRYTRTPT